MLFIYLFIRIFFKKIYFCQKIIDKTEIEIKAKIEELKSKLTGNLFEDGETQQEIYDLKKILNPRIELEPDKDKDEDECVSCGS